jgi:hypothetical protein
MNYRKACEILDLDADNGEQDIDIIKKKYRIKALVYHPDKNSSPDASSKFQDIYNAYDFLLKKEGYIEDDDDDLDADMFDYDEEDMDKNSYRWSMYSFLKTLLKNDTVGMLFYKIINKISISCEKTALENISKLDKPTLLKVFDFLKKYEETFHFAGGFMEKVEEIIKEKHKNDECVILNPTIDDLFENNLYKLTLNNEIYIVPLWHHELVYDSSGCEIYVKCEPILDENITIDYKNNIHVNVTHNIEDIWKKETIEVALGKKIISFNREDLKLLENQVIIVYDGISKINTEYIYDISKKANVYVHLTLVI